MDQICKVSRRQVAALGIGVFCDSIRPLLGAEPRVEKPSYNTFTDDEEIELGREFNKKLASETRFVQDRAILAYLNDIARRLGARSARSNLQYSVQILDVREVNAFAIPGGFLYVTRGLLDVMRSECQLAGVLAHEVGHVAGRHSTNQLSLIFRAKRFYEIVKKQVLRDRDMVGDVIEKLGGALLLLGQLQYSRANETEADLLGYYNMMRAGWHPKGMLQFFNYLTQKEGDPSTIKTILSTHPKSSDRAETIRQEMLIAEPPSNLVETTQSFTAIRASILRLPPPSMKSLPGE